MVGCAGMLSLAATALISAILLHRYCYHGEVSLVASTQPDTYWCTVVGVEEDTSIDQIRTRLLPPLQSSRLLGVRRVPSTSSFASGLDLVLPPFL